MKGNIYFGKLQYSCFLRRVTDGKLLFFWVQMGGYAIRVYGVDKNRSGIVGNNL